MRISRLTPILAVALVMLGFAVASPSATAQGPPTEVKAEARQPEPFLRWMIRASGPIGLVILIMSFYLIAIIAWMFIEFRPQVVMPPQLISEVSDLLVAKKYTEAYQRLSLDTSFLGRTLGAGVRRLPAGLSAAQRAMEMANEDETMQREHRATYLATVGTLGPMIGLLGTVYGMIRSFQVMATSGASPQAGELAEGISTALFATLEGIAISVPAIAFFAYFRNRISRLSLEVAILSESLLEQFSPGVRTPHPLATSPVPRTPPRSEG